MAEPTPVGRSKLGSGKRRGRTQRPRQMENYALKQIELFAPETAAPVAAAHEAWMADRLNQAGLKFNRQCVWMTRVFDFWNHQLGCAVEVDGPEHNQERDSYIDDYMLFRSEVVVIRVPNFDEAAAKAAIEQIRGLDAWDIRRAGERHQKISSASASKRKRLLRSLMASSHAAERAKHIADYHVRRRAFDAVPGPERSRYAVEECAHRAGLTPLALRARMADASVPPWG